MRKNIHRREFLRSVSTGVGGVAFGVAPQSIFATGGTNTWKAGFARAAITPRKSLWMAGYAARRKPAEGTAQVLYAKALALQDKAGNRTVLVATDLLGFPAALSRRIAARAERKFHLTRNRLLLSSSHTHGGPVVDRMLEIAYPMSELQWSDVRDYTTELENTIVNLVGQALKDMGPVHLSFGHGEAKFAVNRRGPEGVNKDGPVDHRVPVLRVEDKHGTLRGIVFGYACHNTAAKDFMQFNGDYAGFAQAWLEDRHPGAVALFMAGCAGDANPHPRGTLDLARQHGEELALAVEKALAGTMAAVRGPMSAGYAEFPVAFAAPPSREELEAQVTHDPDEYRRKWARMMLAALGRDGHLPNTYSYPIEAWQFGPDLTLIALAGEVVVDYDFRLQRELGRDGLWVAAYCNDVFAYIPSLRVLQEGGYEGKDAMVYYGQPGPFAPSIEDTIMNNVLGLVQRVRNEAS